MPESGSLKTRNAPAEGRNKPAATLSSVDLPQPVGPTTETNSPSPTASVTSFTAVYAPAPPPRAAKVQVIRSNSIAAMALCLGTMNGAARPFDPRYRLLVLRDRLLDE